MVEVLLAMFIMALAVLPLFRTFSQSYALATKQSEQQMALKIAEAAINKLLAVQFAQLSGDAPPEDVPFEVQAPSGAVGGVLALVPGGGSLCTIGTASLQLGGRKEFSVQVQVEREFEGRAMGAPPVIGPKTLLFSYCEDSYVDAAIPMIVQQYACSDHLLRISVNVTFGLPQMTLALHTFRVDMNR